MSFDANIGRPQPAIKPATSMNNDGGSGGNTGYMMRGRKKKENSSKNIFGDRTDVMDVDCFEISSGLPRNIDNPALYQGSWFDKFIDKFIK